MMGTEVSEFIDSAYTWQERATKAEAEVERLRMALDKLANPLKYIQMEARAKGAELNGVYAIMLSKDPSYLQEIALAELDKEES